MTNQRRTLAVSIATPGGDNPLLLSLIQTSSIFAGVAVSGLALVAKGGTAPYAFSILATSSNDLPDGLSVASLTGQITGTPTTPGHYTFIAQVQDDASNVFTHSFSLLVNAPLFGVAVTPRPGEIDVDYSYQFIVADATGTRLTSGYSVVDGTVPAGLTVHSNGLMDGTPADPAGSSGFTLRATDGTFTIDFPIQILIYAHFTFIVAEAFIGVDVSMLELPPIRRGVDYLAHAVVTGGAPNGKFSLMAGDSSGPDPWPTGIKIDRNSGKIYGVTTDPATPRMSPLAVPVVGISYVDSLGASLQAFFHLRVVNVASSVRRTPIGDAGDIPLTSTDGSITFSETIDGELDLKAMPGTVGIGSINGVEGGSGGDIEIDGIGVDSNGGLFVESIGSVASVTGTSPVVIDNTDPANPIVTLGAVPIAKGGTGQTAATDAFDALAPTSPTKGDILVYNGTHWVKHTHGTDSQIIAFDSSQTDGLINVDSPFIVPGSLSAAILADLPAAYWKCNDAAGSTTIADSSGNSQTLTTASGLQTSGLAVSQFIPSQTDKYVSFFSVSQWASRTGVPIAVPWSGNLTFECAVCLTDMTTTGINSKLIIEFIGATGSLGAGNAQFGLLFTQLTSYVYSWQAFWENGTNSLITTTFNVQLNADARVVWASIVKDSAAKVLSLYINGRLAVQKPYTNEPSGGAGTLFTVMGVSNRTNGAAPTSSLLGNLGHACLFNSKLSEARIIAHAKAAGLYTG